MNTEMNLSLVVHEKRSDESMDSSLPGSDLYHCVGIGFGFVTFDSDEAVDRATSEQYMSIQNKKVCNSQVMHDAVCY